MKKVMIVKNNGESKFMVGGASIKVKRRKREYNWQYSENRKLAKTLKCRKMTKEERIKYGLQ